MIEFITNNIAELFWGCAVIAGIAIAWYAYNRSRNQDKDRLIFGDKQEGSHILVGPITRLGVTQKALFSELIYDKNEPILDPLGDRHIVEKHQKTNND